MDTWAAGSGPRGGTAASTPGTDLHEVLVAPGAPGPSMPPSLQRSGAANASTCGSGTGRHPTAISAQSGFAQVAMVPLAQRSGSLRLSSDALGSGGALGSGPPASVPEDAPADERSALLGNWQRSDRAGSGALVDAHTPPLKTSGQASKRVPRPAAEGNKVTGSLAGGFSSVARSPFEAAKQALPANPALSSAAGRGPARTASAKLESAPSSNVLPALTSAGDLHTAVPLPQPVAGPQRVSHPGAGAGPAAADATRGGAGGAGGGASGAAGGPSAFSQFASELDDDPAQLTELVRNEQMHHAAQSGRWACLPSLLTLKRAAMVAITAGFLTGAIHLSRLPWGQMEKAGLPRWRWFLIVGCLPTVWYLPWFAIFLAVLLLESLLPLAGAVGQSGGSASGGYRLAAAGGDWRGGDQTEVAAGPALLIYHILGVRRHMVRLLRSVCCQLLIHYAIADHIDPEDRSKEKMVMKVWTCISLFLAANMLKSMIAKALSKRFHSRGYLERMQKAVNQELVLQALSRTRPGRTRSEALTHMGLGYHLASLFGYHHSVSAQGVAQPAHISVGGHLQTPSGRGRPGASPGATGRLSADRHARSSNDLQRDGASQQPGSQGPSQGPQANGPLLPFTVSHIVATSSGVADASLRAGRVSAAGLAQRQLAGRGGISMHSQALSGAGGGSVRGGSAFHRSQSRLDGGRAPPPPPARKRRGLRAAWAWVRDHVRQSYRKTKYQWDLSRPSGSPHGLQAPPPPPTAGSPAGGGATGASGTGGASGTRGASNLNVDQLRTSLFWLEQHIRRNKLRAGVTLSDQLRAAAEGEESEVASKAEAKRLAFWLHMNVLGQSDLQNRMYLVARDFEPFFNSAEEVRDAFGMFDSDRDGRISMQNTVQTIVRIYKERKKLSLTLQDTRTVVAKLELICGVVLHILFAFVYLTIFQVNVRELWLTFSSVTLAFVFVFGNSIRSIYEAVLFLFVVHPFDVGDWLLLANGDTVKVEEIALLFCTFVKGDGRRLYYPNPKLIGEPIINMSRSDRQWESVALLVDLATPGSVLESTERRLKRWLAENPKEFTGSAGVLAKSLANPAKLQLSLFWEYAHTGEDAGRTGRWRSKLVLVLTEALASEGVAYTLPPMAFQSGLGFKEAAAAAVGNTLLSGDDVVTASGAVLGARKAAAAGRAEIVAASGLNMML